MSTSIRISELRTAFRGQVIGPDDAEYDDARTVFVGGIDRRPAVIVRPVDDEEVARVVGLARDSGLELAVRSGGHSSLGHSVSEGGVVLDLSRLTGLDIDAANRTAWAGTGLTAGGYTRAVAEQGFATGFGDTGNVGIGGITLNGGVGYLSRKYGLTIDSVLAADVVTADGRLLRVDAEHHPDLFWAIRGGGGNFGVVTRFQYRLQELPEVVGGMLMLPASPEVVAGFIAEAGAAPEELSTIANVMAAPPMPFVPAEHHGRLVVMGLMCYAGPAEAGERAMAPFRALATPVVDMVKPIPYPGLYPPDEPGYHPIAVGRNLYVDEIGKAQAETILDRLESSPAPIRVAQLRVLGGAVSRVPADATAYAHRNSAIMANVAIMCQSVEEATALTPWVDDFAAALRQSDEGAYVGFLGADGEARMRAAYPGATWDRLTAVKREYDPTNLFRLNQNITPAA